MHQTKVFTFRNDFHFCNEIKARLHLCVMCAVSSNACIFRIPIRPSRSQRFGRFQGQQLNNSQVGASKSRSEGSLSNRGTHVRMFGMLCHKWLVGVRIGSSYPSITMAPGYSAIQIGCASEGHHRQLSQISRKVSCQNR